MVCVGNWRFVIHCSIINSILTIFIIALGDRFGWVICNILAFILRLLHDRLSLYISILSVDLFSHLTVWDVRDIKCFGFLCSLNGILISLGQSWSKANLIIRIMLLFLLYKIFDHCWFSLSSTSLRLILFSLIDGWIFHLLLHYMVHSFVVHLLVFIIIRLILRYMHVLILQLLLCFQKFAVESLLVYISFTSLIKTWSWGINSHVSEFISSNLVNINRFFSFNIFVALIIHTLTVSVAFITRSWR